ncbi:MAG: DUF3108 domain-containing protein [Pontiellaceae bacterium]|nr:DUF3108 domain-containing protein [Pontiellaceae bacterium]MBN2785560.1 DUF3108 domain-containing protein [Pontiellaceae bacterium]
MNLKKVLPLLLACVFPTMARTNDLSDQFIPGEKLEYKIYWMGIPIAWAETTTEKVEEEGRELFHITMTAQTYGAYKHIFEVDDKTEVFIDAATGLPVRHDWIINEGSIHKSHLTTFNHESGVAIFQDRISMDIREVPIEPDTQEIFGFIYSCRNADIEKLTEGKQRLLVTGKMYDLGINITDQDKIKIPELGKIPCYELEPNADFDGIFLRKGKVFFWVSKETPRVITCIKTRVAVGKISAELKSVTSPAPGFWNAESE